MKDYFKECYQPPFSEVPPDKFKEDTCRVCRNLDCVNSGTNSNPWLSRMRTQVDRLLNNPDIADPEDPRFKHIREGLTLEDAFREAIKLEIAAEKGDWEIPSAKDEMQFVNRMNPTGLQTGAPEPDPVPPADLIDDVHSTEREIPKLPKIKEAPQAPAAPRPAHFQAPEPPKPPKPPAPKPPPPRPTAPKPPVQTEQPPPSRSAKVVGPEARNFVPPTNNTKMPAGGIMIGGGPPPPPPTPTAQNTTSNPAVPQGSEPDPWAVPTKTKAKGTVVPVGGKVVLGPPKEEE